MERIEWREAFQRQPAYYLFIDLSAPMSVDNVNLICRVLQNLTTLSISLKRSLRFSVLGIFILCGKIKCVFPLQSVKHNFTKLQLSLESIQSMHTIFTSVNTFDREELSESLQTAIQQYEMYFQGALSNKEEWPQLQIVFFSAQPSQKFLAMVYEGLLTIELSYVRKVHIIILRSQSYSSSHGSSEIRSTEGQESPTIFENEETGSIIKSLLHVTEIEANAYQLENIIKCWLHDCNTDSDHLRLMLGRITLRCDLRESVINAETLPAASQFFLFPETNTPQNAVRPNASLKTQCPPKVPIYMMQAVALVRKDGLCESLLFGHPYITTPTRCWKLDWDELERNQQRFISIIRYLQEKDSVLLAKKHALHIIPTEKNLPTGFFVFFPSKDALLVKSVAVNELLLPLSGIPGKEISDDTEQEIREYLENLEQKDIYNPLSVTCGLYSYLSSTISKCKARPNTSFVVPIIAENEENVSGKKKKCSVVPVAEITSKKGIETYGSDFLTASALIKKRFPDQFE